MMTRISKLTPNARESTGARTAELEVAVVLAERTDVLEAGAEAATIPPTNDAVRTAVAEATASAECPMTLWRCPPPPISVRHLPAGSWFRMRLGSRRVSENTSISMSVLL